MSGDDANGHRLIGIIERIIHNNEGMTPLEIAVFWSSFVQFWDDYISGDVLLDDDQILHVKKIQEL